MEKPIDFDRLAQELSTVRMLLMARAEIRDMVRDEAGILRLEMQQLDHVMDHLGRDLKILEKTLRRDDGKRD